jgi:hypothetical protein
MEFRKIANLPYRGKLYLQCMAVDLRPPGGERCYGIVAADDLTRAHYDALRQSLVVDIPYTGRLYTLEEVANDTWKADLPHHAEGGLQQPP